MPQTFSAFTTQEMSGTEFRLLHQTSGNVLVFPETLLPGEPKITIPPSVAPMMVLFLTVLNLQLRLIPSAHSMTANDT